MVYANQIENGVLIIDYNQPKNKVRKGKKIHHTMWTSTFWSSGRTDIIKNTWFCGVCNREWSRKTDAQHCTHNRIESPNFDYVMEI